MRQITTPAQTQSQRQTGAFPTYVLEVRWAGGTEFYATRTLTSPTDPIDAEARVVEWGEMALDARIEQVGGYGQLTVKLADHDLAIKAHADAEPGFGGAPCYVHLWYVGTSWDDKLTLFAGVVAKRGAGGSEWDIKTATWTLKLDGLEKTYTNDIGLRLTRDRFPEIRCDLAEGKMIPVVYGDPVRRVPAIVIDRPGQSYLGLPLTIADGTLTLWRDADDDFMTLDEEITLYVGVPGNYETITGGFYSGDRRVFTIATRGCFCCSGVTSGIYSDSGRRYVLITAADVPSPASSRLGYLIYLLIGGTFQAFVIDQWFATGAQIAVLNVSGIDVPTGTLWRISIRPAGAGIPLWPAGTPVYEAGDWTYAVNALPSAEVEAVEARAQVQQSGGGSDQYAWFTYPTAAYTVDLDDTDHNTALDRVSGDPGITTITLDRPPQTYGFDDETIYVTLRGITDDDTPSGDVVANPARVIRHLLGHPLLGNVPDANIRDSAFTTAAAAITDEFAFAMLEPRKLLEACAQLAFQAKLIFFWDQGRAHVALHDHDPTYAERVITISPGNALLGSLKIADPGEVEKVSVLTGEWEPFYSAGTRKITRKSTDAIDAFGRQEKTIKLWAYQDVTIVAKIVEFWLRAFLSVQRQVTVTTFLNGISLQPGDRVGIDWPSAAGDVFQEVGGRVSKLRHVMPDSQRQKMAEVTMTLDVRLWPVTIEVAVPDEDRCDASGGDVSGGGGGGIILPPPDDPIGTTFTTGSTSSTSGSSTASTGSSTTEEPCPACDNCWAVNIPFDITCTSPFPLSSKTLTAGNYELPNVGSRTWNLNLPCDPNCGYISLVVRDDCTAEANINLGGSSGAKYVGSANGCGSLTLTRASQVCQSSFPLTLTFTPIDCDDITSSTTTGTGSTGSTTGGTGSTGSTTGGTGSTGSSTGGTGSTGSTSSTTEEPCAPGNGCWYEWNGLEWTPFTADCNAPCDCACPTGQGAYVGQLVHVSCVEGGCITTSSTTTASTTTGTTTASTTTGTTTGSTTTASSTTTSDPCPCDGIDGLALSISYSDPAACCTGINGTELYQTNCNLWKATFGVGNPTCCIVFDIYLIYIAAINKTRLTFSQRTVLTCSGGNVTYEKTGCPGFGSNVFTMTGTNGTSCTMPSTLTLNGFSS